MSTCMSHGHLKSNMFKVNSFSHPQNCFSSIVLELVNVTQAGTSLIMSSSLHVICFKASHKVQMPYLNLQDPVDPCQLQPC